MKPTDEQLRIVAAICKNHRYSNNGERYQWSSEIFLAGCAWQLEQDAKLCDKLAEMQWPAFKQFAVAIRAQGDDRE